MRINSEINNIGKVKRMNYVSMFRRFRLNRWFILSIVVLMFFTSVFLAALQLSRGSNFSKKVIISLKASQVLEEAESFVSPLPDPKSQADGEDSWVYELESEESSDDWLSVPSSVGFLEVESISDRSLKVSLFLSRYLVLASHVDSISRRLSACHSLNSPPSLSDFTSVLS